MYIRRVSQASANGPRREYAQIVASYRRPDGTPTNRVVAHLGRIDDLLYENLKQAFSAARRGRRLVEQVETETPSETLDVGIDRNLVYAPLAVVSHYFRGFGLDRMLDAVCPRGRQTVPASIVVEALVAQRCLAPDSKLAFQAWLPETACEEVLGAAAKRLHNTRVHRTLTELAAADEALQEQVATAVVDHGGRPRVLYLDLTDTWFEAGGGTLARKGETKAGHRSKRKINIALMVNERGLPMRWELLPGALSETTVLPEWLPHVRQSPRYASAFLVFDRGLPSVANFRRLVDPETGHLFLTSVKSDSIPTYVSLDRANLDELQRLADDAPPAAIAEACARLALEPNIAGTTFRKDLGFVTPPRPGNRSTRECPPAMRMYLYFNPEIWQTKRQRRVERIAAVETFVSELNQQLGRAKRSRRADVILASITERLRRLKLLEVYEIELQPLDLGTVKSYQVHLKLRSEMLANMCRHDGLSLLVAHPDLDLDLDEAIEAYRQKNAVEADFRTIKSVLALRPTFHWTDKKILAHVTLCVLALLVERLIEARLPEGEPRTAATALAQLASYRLNRIRVGDVRRLVLTRPDGRATRLLGRLNCRHILESFPTSVPVVTGAAAPA